MNKANEQLTERIAVRVTPGLKAAVQQAAVALNVTERTFVRWVLARVVAQPSTAARFLEPILGQQSEGGSDEPIK